MISFQCVYSAAVRRKGGEEILESLMPKVLTSPELQKLGHDRVLAEMSRCVFQAGFVWRVIQQKWSGFEDVFEGFDPEKILAWPDAHWEQVSQDKRIVRNPQKIRTVLSNARFIDDIALEYGSFGYFLADWPSSNLIGLLDLLKKRGSRLGGNTGQRVLRNLGKDAWVLSSDVIRCLMESGLDISEKATSKKDFRAIQDTFNAWHEETGKPFAHLSKIAAYSTGENYAVDVIQTEMSRWERATA